MVNDIHSQLNATPVHFVATPRDIDELCAALITAKWSGRPISIAGGRHSMGGQQFGAGTTLIDMRGLGRVLDFDRLKGRVTVEGGVQWPELLGFLDMAQHGDARPWGIYQKQTGADRLTIAGALSCNAHGRGLAPRPMVDQVESFDLLTAAGHVLTCSRVTHPRLFSLVIGGYGLFGIITRVTLRLRRRVKLRRVVSIAETAQLMDLFAARIRDGFEYGDFQFAIDPDDEGFLRRGVFSCYQPVPAETAITERPLCFSADDWASLILDAHCDKQRAFERYADGYLRTSGQVYTSDDQLSGAYVDDYHRGVDRSLGCHTRGSEMITELYVPRARFEDFMRDTRLVLRQRHANVIYGTVRLTERDTETVLAWARAPYACIVLNLHVDHTPIDLATTAETFRQLIDVAIRHGGSYYLTYHRWARRDQVLRCYPQMPAFLAGKRRYDPDELFQSDWYRCQRRMFGAIAGKSFPREREDVKA